MENCLIKLFFKFKGRKSNSTTREIAQRGSQNEEPPFLSVKVEI